MMVRATADETNWFCFEAQIVENQFIRASSSKKAVVGRSL